MDELSAELAALKKRSEKARTQAEQTAPLREDAYRFVIPYRKGTKQTGVGARRVDEVFDHTAIDSAMRFAGRLQQDFWPAEQTNFALRTGPGFPIAQKDEGNKILEQITNTVQAGCFEDGQFDLAFHEMGIDLSVGTGAMALPFGNDDGGIWDPTSIPMDELNIEQGGGNRISGIFWPRRMSMRELYESYPDGAYGAELMKLYREAPETEIDVHYDCVFERKERREFSRWKFVVWADKQPEKPIHVKRSRTQPIVVSRYFRVPGETWGRGPVLLAMPTIKTVNAAQRLQLQAAAIAMLGIYTAVDDGVFNPSQSPLTPGSFMKVARNGGALGPSVQRLPDPRLDLTGLVIENMQMRIKATMLDEALPVEGAAVKSATEILERVKRLAQDHIGAFGRLIKEITIPVVKRAIEGCYEAGLLADIPDINQVLVKLQIKSPLALAHEAQRVQRIVQWLEMVLAILAQLGTPDRADEIAQVDKALREIGTAMGVPTEYITTEDEAKTLREDKQKQQLALAAASAVGQGGLQGLGGAA